MPAENDARITHEINHGRVLAETGQRNWMQDSWVGQARILRRSQLMAKAVGMGPGRRALELGFGTGTYTMQFAATGVSLDAIDISPDLKALAEKRLHGRANVRLLLGNAEMLDGCLDDGYDAVVGNGILHHLNARRVLGSLFRVLKPGGRLVFVEPNMLNPQVALIKNVGWLKRHYEESPDETAYFRWQMAKLLREAGFVSVSVEPIDFAHPALSEGPARALAPFFEALERIPLVREIAGALFIRAEKPKR